MCMRALQRIFPLWLFSILLTLPAGWAQQPEELTVEWIYSDASREPTALPRFQWLADNTAMFFDMQKPVAERTFEIFDPASGERKPALDRTKALQSLQAVLGEDQAPKRLRWPVAFDAAGRKAVYLLRGDVFVLHLRDAKVQRITETEATEKSVNFSPDGKKLAYVRENDLYVYDLERKKETRLTADGADTILNGTLSWVYWEEIFGRRDIGYWWSPDSRALAFLRTDESPVSVMHYVDFKPAVPRVITQRYPKAGGKNPIVRVGIVELAGSATTWVKLPQDAYEYIARVKWLPDGKRVSVQTMNRGQDRLDLYFAERNGGEIRHILQESDTAWVNINDDLYFLKDNKHFIWASERDGYAHLYRYTLDGKLVNQITRGAWAIRSSGGGVYWLRRAVAAIDEKNGRVYFTALEKSSIEKHLYRIKFDGTGMERLSQEDGTHAITFSPDGKYYFDVYSTARALPVLRLHRNDGRQLRVVAASRPELLAKFNLQRRALFTIPARDGFRLPASLLKPADFDPQKKYPVIFAVYGGPSAPRVADAWRSSLYFDNILAKMGFLVAEVDNRSATAISKILENTINRQMSGDSELNDLVDAVKWFKSQPWVDPDRVGIWGWSGGGSFTLLAMTRSEEFKAGIAVAPVTDWHYYDTKWAEFGMKRPQDNPEGYEKTSLVKRAKDLHGRLMLVHGTYDDNVHPQNTWAFSDALIRAGIQFDMMIYPMRKHGISDRPARRHLFNKMLAFWQQNL